MWILAVLFSLTGIMLFLRTMAISKRVTKIERLNIQLDSLRLVNSQIMEQLKEQNRIIKQNSDFSDRYIEQLHTKITELEVTLQNIVNKK